MARVREMTLWDVTAWLAATAGCNVLTRKPVDWKELHPLRSKHKRESLALLEADWKKASEMLPKTCTEEEFDRRYEAYQRALAAQKG